MKRVLSGIQPSGQLHLGNYLGAVQNWVKLQHDYESFYSIVDMHAISSIYFQSTKGTDLANGLNQQSRLTAATLIACGLDPDRIFIQSSIPYFAELTWIFGCISPLSWLNRMTQFKDKKQALKGASLGLFSYPVLMAADILAFKAEVIPVGDDQQQHIELARDIAERFNSVFQPTFPLPTPLFTSVSRVMSLRNPNEKMSKSSRSDFSRVNLLDPPDIIEQKILRAKTDSVGTIEYDEQERPEIANLIRIYAEITGTGIVQVEEIFKEATTHEFKHDLAARISDSLAPVRGRTLELLQDQETLLKYLKRGRERVMSVTGETVNEVKRIIGFVTF